MAEGKRERVLVISDLQAPFQHTDAYDFLEAVAACYKPTRIVCIGDEVDFHALSGFHNNPDGFSAGDEAKRAVEALKPLYSRFPTTSVCISNHTCRPYRVAFSAGLPTRFLRDYQEFLEAPSGWTWEDHYIIDGVRYEHGHTLGGGKSATQTAPLANMRSTVFGHFHTNAGIHYVASPEALLFGFNVGCLIDFDAYAFHYMRGAKKRPIIGCGVVNYGIPTFIPMLLKRGGRWVGKLIE